MIKRVAGVFVLVGGLAFAAPSFAASAIPLSDGMVARQALYEPQAGVGQPQVMTVQYYHRYYHRPYYHRHYYHHYYHHRHGVRIGPVVIH